MCTEWNIKIFGVWHIKFKTFGKVTEMGMHEDQYIRLHFQSPLCVLIQSRLSVCEHSVFTFTYSKHSALIYKVIDKRQQFVFNFGLVRLMTGD